MWSVYGSLAKRLLAPLARPFVRRVLGARLVRFRAQSIGHLALEPDAFLKDGLLGWRPHFRPFWLVKPERVGRLERVANRCLLEYWSRQIHLVRSSLLRRLLWPFVEDPVLGFDTRVYVDTDGERTASVSRIQQAWGQRAPLLELWTEHRERGRRVLAELGVPADAWFVCVHCREPGFSPHGSYRNADIFSYIPAIQAISQRGGWCIRVGDPSMKALPVLENTVDYALHPAKSDWMDIFLCGGCRIFLGGNSGLANVATTFGVPIGMVNVLPLGAVLPFGRSGLGIPKLLRSRRDGRLLTIKEMLDSPLSMFSQDSGWDGSEVTILDSASDEIRELALELLDIAAGTVSYSEEDEELQCRFKAMMRPGHYSFGSSARISRYFLQKHRNLLGDIRT